MEPLPGYWARNTHPGPIRELLRFGQARPLPNLDLWNCVDSSYSAYLRRSCPTRYSFNGSLPRYNLQNVKKRDKRTFHVKRPAFLWLNFSGQIGRQNEEGPVTPQRETLEGAQVWCVQDCCTNAGSFKNWFIWISSHALKLGRASILIYPSDNWGHRSLGRFTDLSKISQLVNVLC